MGVRLRKLPWAIGAVCGILGFVLVMQVRVQQEVALKQVTALQRSQELVQQLQRVESERDALLAELDQLRSHISQSSGQQELAEQVQQLQLRAGLLPLTGPGVIATMNYAVPPGPDGAHPSNSVIQDEDILRVINELVGAGAEAMAVNGQRLIDRSEIRAAGRGIVVNGVPSDPPVIITAIGDPALLESIITMRGGVAEGLKQWGIHVSVQKMGTVTVPAYKGELKFRVGTPVEPP